MRRPYLHLEHGYGWNRTLVHDLTGVQTWCGLGVLGHNAVNIANLLDRG
jgi:hypothetical protein